MQTKSNSLAVEVVIIECRVRFEYLLELFLRHTTSLVKERYFEKRDTSVVYILKDSYDMQYDILVSGCKLDRIRD